MPLHQHFRFQHFEIAIWEISESAGVLERGVKIHPSEERKFEACHRELRRQEFLALRKCLQQIYGDNPPVHYLASGKPYLEKGDYLSFSHTKGFAAVIKSKMLPVGIDLEGHRPGLQAIKKKFMRSEEDRWLHPESEIAHLAAYWGAKESIVKIEDNRKLDFRKHIRVHPFRYRPQQSTKAFLLGGSKKCSYRLFFRKISDLTLSYGWRLPL